MVNSIRTNLKRRKLTQDWLIMRLNEDYEISISRGELSNILSGTQTGAKADSIISKSEEIINVYERNNYPNSC